MARLVEGKGTLLLEPPRRRPWTRVRGRFEGKLEAARNAAAAKRLADVEDGVQSLLELTRGADGVMVDYDFDASDDDDASSDDDDAGASHSNASVRPNVWLCTCASGLNSPRHAMVPTTCADGAPGVQPT